VKPQSRLCLHPQKFGVRRTLYITASCPGAVAVSKLTAPATLDALSVHLCVQHDARETARCAGPSSTADTCCVMTCCCHILYCLFMIQFVFTSLEQFAYHLLSIVEREFADNDIGTVPVPWDGRSQC